MSRNALVRPTVLVAAALLASALAGCLPVFYAYPVVGYVPAVSVDAPREEVRAFRVYLKDDQNCVDFPEHDRYVLSEIPLRRSGTVPAQTIVALDHGWIWNCIALYYESHTSHSVRVRLYRFGWETVEIKQAMNTGPIHWTEAPNAEAQEKAIDDLLSTWETDLQPLWHHRSPEPPRDPEVFRCLAPGSASSAHRQVLSFAAAEYDRLTSQLRTIVAASQQRERLIAKARHLRELATR